MDIAGLLVALFVIVVEACYEFWGFPEEYSASDRHLNMKGKGAIAIRVVIGVLVFASLLNLYLNDRESARTNQIAQEETANANKITQDKLDDLLALSALLEKEVQGEELSYEEKATLKRAANDPLSDNKLETVPCQQLV